MKKILIAFISLFLVININIAPIQALPSFKVVSIAIDGTYSVIEEKGTYNDAFTRYSQLENDYTNLAILRDDTYVYVKNGIVAFQGSCNATINYTNAANNESGYTNACYGADGLFLGVNASQSRVKFQLSGVIGWVNIESVKILPIEAIANVSSYVVINKDLIHQIKTNINSPKYAALLNNGIAPNYLNPDTTYYSYDGHYFYDDFSLMVSDVRNSSTNRAINPLEPYYNYYQYVAHRTLTTYSPSELRSYLQNTLGINKALNQYCDNNGDMVFDIITQSQFYDAVEAFFESQYLYGSNALMMLSLAMNETAYGRSALAYTRNNLFGHAAYDSAVEANASRYSSVASSINSHALNFISNTYANSQKWQYRGSFFGNKGSGMNVSYASDPYWGEKAAQYYLRIDRQLGSHDYNAYQLGIKESGDNVNIYARPNYNSDVLYGTGKHEHYAFVILEEVVSNNARWYKVQTDTLISSTNDDNKYDFTANIGYIHSSAIAHLIDGNTTLTLSTYTYDANGGKFNDGSSVIRLNQNSEDISLAQIPTKEQAIFDKWEKNEHTYTATYIDIKDAFILGDYKTVYNKDTFLNLKDMNFVFVKENNERISIPVTSSMCSRMYLNELGTITIKITYYGITREISVFVGNEDNAYREMLYNDLMELVNKSEKTKVDYISISNLCQEINELGYNFTSDELAQIDEVIQNSTNKLQVIITKNKFNLGISGLSTYLDYETITKDLLPNVLRVNATSLSPADSKRLLQVSTGNEWQVYDGFKLEATYLKAAVDMSHNYTLSIEKPSFDDLSQLYIILALKDDEVYRLYGKQSDSYITFDTKGFDTFLIAYQKTNNEYSDTDTLRINRIDNNGTDYRTLYLLGLIGGISLIIILCGGYFVYNRMKKRQLLIKKRKLRQASFKE